MEQPNDVMKSTDSPNQCAMVTTTNTRWAVFATECVNALDFLMTKVASSFHKYKANPYCCNKLFKKASNGFFGSTREEGDRKSIVVKLLEPEVGRKENVFK